MRNPYKDASSTQIMTYNILYGFNRIAEQVIFVPIVINKCDMKDIREYYSKCFDRIIFLNNITTMSDKRIMVMISACLRMFFHNKEYIKVFESMVNKDTVIVSSSPTVDAAIVCSDIKKRFPDVEYVQYWSDPITLSLITPSEYTMKRIVWKYIEKKLHFNADKVAFGTKSLYKAQCELFPELEKKGYGVHVAYNPNAKDVENKKKEIVFGYFGNYYSKIRDVRPLYEAFKETNEKLVICGRGDIKFESSNNIEIRERVSQAEVGEYEDKVDVIVCVLNKCGQQIPGKVFYQTNTLKHILVVLDGPRKDEIKGELCESERFIFCDNTKENIIEAIEIIKKTKKRRDKCDFYNPERVAKEIVRF